MVKNASNAATAVAAPPADQTKDEAKTSLETWVFNEAGSEIANLLQDRFDVKYFIGQTVVHLMGEGREKEYELARKHPKELIKVVMHQAILRLQVGLGLCHIVRFGNSLQLMVDYKGYLEVAGDHPKIRQIITKAVYEKDEIDIDSNRKPPIQHKVSLDDDRGKLRGAYAQVEFTNGTFDYRWCPESEILDIRNKYSKAWKQGGSVNAWKDRPSEMYVKTAVNLLWKILPKTDRMAQLYQIDNEASAEIGRREERRQAHDTIPLEDRLEQDLYPQDGPVEDAEFSEENAAVEVQGSPESDESVSEGEDKAEAENSTQAAQDNEARDKSQSLDPTGTSFDKDAAKEALVELFNDEEIRLPDYRKAVKSELDYPTEPPPAELSNEDAIKVLVYLGYEAK